MDIKSLTRLEKRSILIRPVQSEISAFCTELTTLTPEMFTNAGSLADAVRILKNEYLSKDRQWASWGDYDRRQFERVCADQSVGYPFGPSHLNVKSLFAAATGSANEMGLDGAYKHLGLTMEDPHHRGDDDAWESVEFIFQINHQLPLRFGTVIRAEVDQCKSRLSEFSTENTGVHNVGHFTRRLNVFSHGILLSTEYLMQTLQ